MLKSLASFAAILLGTAAGLVCLPARAQTSMAAGAVAAPDYGSDASAGSSSFGNFNTPEADGRPGVYYFDLGAAAFEHGDFRHAIDMYKVAASWAYKPAEYNLGVMYFRGQGVPVDRPLGAAWMVLAAERGDPQYVKARDLMVTVLSKVEFARTDELWAQLKPTYGDAVALRRAKARWKWVASHQTGTHVAGGTPGELHVGERAHIGYGRSKVVPTTPGAVLSAGSVDGSVAYRQFQQSDNPYDPIFLKNRTGSVTVEPLQPLKRGKQPAEQPAPPSSTQLPRNA